MSYDIGIGICAAAEGDTVDVRLDSAMLSRLVPNQQWRRSGTSLLRLPARLCSQKRPPTMGSEVYLPHTALAKTAKALLDAEGDGRFVPVDLAVLARGPQPNVVETPAAKSRSARW